MRLSTRWLEELVGLGGASPEAIAAMLTFHTAHVESVDRVGRGLAGVLTGKVVAVRPHPNADRLRLCTVETGVRPTQEVVCGAPNVAEGQVVCFAPEGTTLPGGLVLSRRKIRGVESAGMILAEDEMGLGASHEGIVVLPPGTPVGIPAGEALGLADDVLVVDNPDITHRPDLWGHVGWAREVGALLARPFEPPPAAAADAAFAAATGDPFPVSIEDEEGCRRYVGVLLEGLENGPSPWALRGRLEALGLRSVSLLVDLSNLVMLEQGQPVHAFDARDLEGGRIVVRAARDGESMTTLDGVVRRLDPGDLVIEDGARPVALAGVMGGENSEVRSDTTTLLLEAASFDPVRVRRTATRLGLRTEASTRFEKALDPEAAWAAARRFTELVLRHVPGARVARRVADAYPCPAVTPRILLPYDLPRRRLGIRISDAEVRASLLALGFGVEERGDALAVDVPTWRATKDIQVAEDLVEEVGRVHGYEHVPAVPPVGALEPTRPSIARRLERRVEDLLSRDLAYAESKSYSFYGPRDVERLALGAVRHVEIQNPNTDEQDRLAVTTLPAMLRFVERNVAREATGRTWESTRLFVPSPDGRLPDEVRVVALATWSREGAEGPDGRLFLDLLEDVRAVLRAGPVAEVHVREADDDACLAEGLPPPRWLHPGRRAVVEARGRRLAIAGEVAPRVLRAFEIPGRVAVAEISLDRMGEVLEEVGASYRPIHRYPVVPFDVAVVVPRRTPAGRVESVIREVDRARVRRVRVFDVYEGPSIPEGHRSLAFSLELLDPEGTLEPKQADRLRRRVVEAVEREGWTVRTADA